MSIIVGILNTVLGCVMVYGILLGSGMVMYGNISVRFGCIIAALAAGFGIFASWKKQFTKERTGWKKHRLPIELLKRISSGIEPAIELKRQS